MAYIVQEEEFITKVPSSFLSTGFVLKVRVLNLARKPIRKTDLLNKCSSNSLYFYKALNELIEKSLIKEEELSINTMNNFVVKKKGNFRDKTAKYYSLTDKGKSLLDSITKLVELEEVSNIF